MSQFNMEDEEFIENLIKIENREEYDYRLSFKKTYEDMLPNFNSMMSIEELLFVTKEEYKVLQNEIRIFIQQVKGKFFYIKIYYQDNFDMAKDYVFKIKPLVHFLISRNISHHKDVSLRFKRILEIMDNIGLDRYVHDLANEDVEYGRSLMMYKLNRLVIRYENQIRTLIMFIFNAQPINRRTYAQATVGLGSSEFQEIIEEGIED